jgi:hypothetical protein
MGFNSVFKGFNTHKEEDIYSSLLLFHIYFFLFLSFFVFSFVLSLLTRSVLVSAMFHLKTEGLLSLRRNSIPDYCCPICDEAETGEEHGLAASPSSSNNLTNFRPLQIPSTKPQVTHLIGSSNIELLSPLPHVPVKKWTQQQGTIIPSWNVTEHTETEANQSKKKQG